MLMLYFSGTGNSKYVATQFAAEMKADCHSIEEAMDFDSLIHQADTVCFCYPVYGSCVPRIMREFVTKHREALADKSLVIFCTQMMFSGDGARAFTDLLPCSKERVLYADHFNMPNNISNFWLLPIGDRERRRKLRAVNKQLKRVCGDIRKGIVKQRGWSRFSHWLGLLQRKGWPKVEEKRRSSFQADTHCNRCGLCVKLCPMNNLELTAGGVAQRDNCILCYRCVNACPQKAAMVLLHTKPKRQYKGIIPATTAL